MKDNLDVITLRGLSAVGSHGVHDFERSGSQVFSADIKLYLDATKAAETDDVQYTVDYGAIAEDAVAVLTGAPVYLIETLANQLAEMAMTYPLVQIVEVTVHKPMAPVRHQFADVSVTLRRSRASEEPELLATKSTFSHGDQREVAEVLAPPAEPDVVDSPARPDQDSAAPAPTPTPELEPKPRHPRTFPSRTSVHGAATRNDVAEMLTAGDEKWTQHARPAQPTLRTRQQPRTQPASQTPEMPPKPTQSRALRHRARHARKYDTTPITQSIPTVHGNKYPPLKIDRSFDGSSHIYQVVLALGANQGPILENMTGAIEALASTPGFEVLEVSPLVRTEPVLEPGALPQADFYNAIVIGRTVMAPPVLLESTKYIEREFGRVPGRRWSARPLDIDIIKIDQMRVTNKDLTLPHPRAKERAFVLYPWWLLDPDATLIDAERIADYLRDAPDLAGVLGVREDWLGQTGRADRGEQEIELAPRTSTRRGRLSVSKETPTVEVRGEKLHLAPLEGDPIFQRLLDGEKRPDVTEPGPAPDVDERIETAAPDAGPVGQGPFVQYALEDSERLVPFPDPDVPAEESVSAVRELPDWRFSVTPGPSRIVDDTSRVVVEGRRVDAPHGSDQPRSERAPGGGMPSGSQSAQPDGGPAPTPREGVSNAPRPRVARRVTLRPTPTGSQPVARRARNRR